MTIYFDSRYADAIPVLVTSEKGVALTLYMRPPNTNKQYRLYTVVQGDSLDILAYRFYGDPRLYWMIANMNPQVHFPDGLPAGTVLRVPL